MLQAIASPSPKVGPGRDDPASLPLERILLYLAEATLPPALVHSSALLRSTYPCPLQSFLPLQEFSAPAQLPLPLHALIPAQCTSPPAFSAARATTLPARIRLAAALAMSMPRRTL